MLPHQRGRPRRTEFTTTNTCVRLTDAERAALQSHATARDEPLSVVIRNTLAEAGLLEPYEEKPAPKPKRRKKTTEEG